MASSIPCLSGLTKPFPKRKVGRSLQVRAQSFGDEGSSANMVDANLSVLRERIEEVKMKERLKRCCKSEDGWYYQSGYDHKLKRDAKFSESLELVGLVSMSVGLSFFSGTLCLCLVSLLVHLNQ
ncbi:hypothetical protein HHK36_014901 [Tetracentron sinense]|uniref:Uncharacterized protein n=1 Tax=Tetracentron sinense TaxID=13715 RepID=A0A834Z225_TETSI|nr:hypothetical protein HHK36_014901 [Tetracentron sinense]